MLEGFKSSLWLPLPQHAPMHYTYTYTYTNTHTHTHIHTYTHTHTYKVLRWCADASFKMVFFSSTSRTIYTDSTERERGEIDLY